MKKLMLAVALCCLGLGVAQAEKADASKPTKIDYDDLQIDDVKQIKTLLGNVVLTRGTLLMKSPKAVVTTDPEGYNFVVLTSTPMAPLVNKAITAFLSATGMRECNSPTCSAAPPAPAPCKAWLNWAWVSVALRRSSASLSSIRGQTQ